VALTVPTTDRLAHLAWRTMYTIEHTRPNYGRGMPDPAFVRAVQAAPELKTKPDACYWRVRYYRQNGELVYEERFDGYAIARRLFLTAAAAWAGLLVQQRGTVRRLEQQLLNARTELGELEQLARFHRDEHGSSSGEG